METFAILGFVFGMMGMVGFTLSIIAIARISNLIIKLKEFDVIPDEFDLTNKQVRKMDR